MQRGDLQKGGVQKRGVRKDWPLSHRTGTVRLVFAASRQVFQIYAAISACGTAVDRALIWAATGVRWRVYAVADHRGFCLRERPHWVKGKATIKIH